MVFIFILVKNAGRPLYQWLKSNFAPEFTCFNYSFDYFNTPIIFYPIDYPVLKKRAGKIRAKENNPILLDFDIYQYGPLHSQGI